MTGIYLNNGSSITLHDKNMKLSKKYFFQIEYKEEMQILVKTIHAIMEGHVWSLVTPSSVIAHLVTKDPVVMVRTLTWFKILALRQCE